MLSAILLKVCRIIKRDPILLLAVLLAGISCFFVPPSLSYFTYLDLRILVLLWALMLAVKGFQQETLLDWMVGRVFLCAKHTRTLSGILIGLCFFGSMWITNDVALVSFVPLAILLFTRIGKARLLLPVIVLQTIAANLGSMLTPLGNPQNLYLYSLANMGLLDFITVMAIPTAFSFLLLLGSLFLIPRESVSPPDPLPAPSLRRIGPWIFLFGVCLLSVMRMVPYEAVFVIGVVFALWRGKGIWKQVDYGLLATFLFFFLFIGNVKNISPISAWLTQQVQGREFWLGIVLSQGISNVPAAILLSGFTTEYVPLLLGVNMGGLGTLIASMASLISYKQYVALPGAKPGRYLLVFTVANVLFLSVLVGLLCWMG